MSLINATADWGLHGTSLWSHKGKETWHGLSCTFSFSQVWNNLCNSSGGIFPNIINFD